MNNQKLAASQVAFQTQQTQSFSYSMRNSPSLGAPRLVLRVGITGHRLVSLQENHFDAHLLMGSIRSTLILLRKLAEDIALKSAESYAGPHATLRLISPLAEGADRIAAAVALEDELHYELECPLPFAREQYEEDFSTPESRQEFRTLLEKASSVLELDGQRSTSSLKKLAYAEVGQTVLRQCDILLAVWDGKPAEGIGGTGAIVKSALQQHLPILWIEASKPHRVCLYESGKQPQWGNLEDITNRIKAILEAPSESELVRFHHFIREKPPRWTLNIEMTPFKVRNSYYVRPSISIKDFRVAMKNEWSRAWHALSRLTARRLDGHRLRRFLRADRLAETCANKYRISLLFSYLMGALAVLFAFLGYHTKNHTWYEGELILIISIVLLTKLAHQRRWHERWIDYRLLAEGLRQIRILAPVARATSLQAPDESEKEREISWVNWYLRAITREDNLPSCRIDQGFLASYRNTLASALQSQESYHKKNAQELEKLHHSLHDITQRFFLLAAVACALHLIPTFWTAAEDWLIAYHLHNIFEMVLNLCVIVLPMFGAAIGAILHQREFDWTALRSNALRGQLKEISERLPMSNETISLNELGEVAEYFSNVLLNELSDWGLVFRRKELSFPA